jgi:DNA polymerase (family X)
MIMKNIEISEIFTKMADILELKDDNIFKINAYRKASRILKDMQEDVEELCKSNSLKDIQGFGKAITGKIEEYLSSGKIIRYEELKHEISKGLIKLLKIQNLGPKTVVLANKKLNVKSIIDLKRVIEDGSLAQLPGMGEKKVANIKKNVEYFLKSQSRITLGSALPIAEEIVEFFKEKFPNDKFAIAGSIRRGKETAGDINILAASNDGLTIVDSFINLPLAIDVLSNGETKSSIRIDEGFQVDLKVVEPESFGAALQYFTGSQAHNIKLREFAKKKLYKINEYGVFKNEKKICGATEKDVYNSLGLNWIPPELREDRGEVELAIENKLPELIDRADIKGDLHVHSNYSDGKNSIREMVEQAKVLGYSYLAICDHSKAAYYAKGINEERLYEQGKEIDALNKKMSGFKILKGIEVDILSDGSMDFDDKILKQLDIVVASIHSAFKHSPTKRIINAMENPYVDIIAHPTSRLITIREGYDIDLNLIFEKAVETRTTLELSSHPDRLDLSDINAKNASAKGAIIAINTDSHRIDNLKNIKYGISTARRAWLQKNKVLNCLSVNELMQWRNKRIEEFEKNS